MNREAWIRKALEEGYDSFEIYQDVEEEKKYSWYKGALDTFVTSHVSGTALRGIYGGRLANYATEDDSDEQMDRVLSLMKEQALAVTSEDKVFIREPEKTDEYTDTRKFEVPSAGEVKELLSDIEKRILAYDERVISVNEVEWEEIVSKREIVNSKGLSVKDKSRIHLVMAECAVMEKEEIKDSYDYKAVERISGFDRESFVKKLCEKALKKLGASSLKSGNYPVIIDREAMSDLLGAFSYLFSGDLISKGISPLRDKLDMEIFSGKITVVDDPRCPDSYLTDNYDDEGCPTHRKEVVREGVFATALHNSKTAAKMGTVSTGNGFKSGYASSVGVAPLNLYIAPGERSLEELMAEMGEGLVIDDVAGLHAGIDHVTGNFSLQCAGYRVEGGKRAESVTLITMAGNFLEMMKKVRKVGNDLEWGLSTVTAPSILFEEVAIAGE